jgi:hypothetical protein
MLQLKKPSLQSLQLVDNCRTLDGSNRSKADITAFFSFIVC